MASQDIVGCYVSLAFFDRLQPNLVKNIVPKGNPVCTYVKFLAQNLRPKTRLMISL